MCMYVDMFDLLILYSSFVCVVIVLIVLAADVSSFSCKAQISITFDLSVLQLTTSAATLPQEELL